MRLSSAALAIAVLAAGCDAPATTTLSESRSAAIEDSVAAFLATWSHEPERDGWDRMAERYADDPSFIWVEDGHVRYTSREEIRAGFDALASSFSGARTEFTEPSITALAPGLAHVTTRFATTLTREGGSDVRFGGAMTMTTIHTEEGWKVLRGHTSSERERRRGEPTDSAEAGAR